MDGGMEPEKWLTDPILWCGCGRIVSDSVSGYVAGSVFNQSTYKMSITTILFIDAATTNL